MVEVAIVAEAHRSGVRINRLGKRRSCPPTAFGRAFGRAFGSTMLLVCHFDLEQSVSCRLTTWEFKKARTNSSRAFSTVVADNQFATLGVVLLSALARLTRATGIEIGPNAKVESTIKQARAVASIEEDRGERVSRNQAKALGEPYDAPLSKPVVRSVENDYKNQRKKKPSKRKKNAIDDLFSGLL